MGLVAFDFETLLFGPCNLAPKPVCCSFSFGPDEGTVVASCESEFDDMLEHALKADEITNAKIDFDMAVILAHRPKLAPLVWDAYSDKRVHDILIREKLITLGTWGHLDYLVLPNGAKSKVRWSQADIEKRRLSIDRTEQKDSPDAWRSNYEALIGMPAKDYPEDAYKYSYDDADLARKIHVLQSQNRDLLSAEHLSVSAALALYLSSCWGFSIDTDLAQALFEELSERFHEKNFSDLVRMGILRPSQPSRPHVRQMQKAINLVGKDPGDWGPYRQQLEEAGFKLTAEKPSNYNTTLLRALVAEICQTYDIEVVLTEGGEDGENKQVSYSSEVQENLKGFNPAFDSFIDRNEIQKLVTTELPRMLHGRVHPKYDVLKETGRTSSFGNSKKDKDPAYPSVNIQQIDPRVRDAFIADPGHVICSIDYNFIELVSAAQTCLDIFGYSELADKINRGYDPHAYLASCIARKLDPEFKYSKDNDTNYALFQERKKTDPPWYRRWRTMAKPTGLGFPGGLGAKTFVGYAKATFGVDMVNLAGSQQGALEMASSLKAEWLQAFPEFEAYFRWVNMECLDLEWSTAVEKRYAYSTPNGMVRRNCFYCPATNGRALQSPTAEGAKIALFMLASAMHDARLKSSLLGCHQLAFIHDEFLLQLPDDAYRHERAFEARDIVVEGMKQVMTKVLVGAEPALMLRWNKKAEPVFDNNKRLILWSSK
jgi:hypothetical protein